MKIAALNPNFSSSLSTPHLNGNKCDGRRLFCHKNGHLLTLLKKKKKKHLYFGFNFKFSFIGTQHPHLQERVRTSQIY